MHLTDTEICELANGAGQGQSNILRDHVACCPDCALRLAAAIREPVLQFQEDQAALSHPGMDPARADAGLQLRPDTMASLDEAFRRFASEDCTASRQPRIIELIPAEPAGDLSTETEDDELSAIPVAAAPDALPGMVSFHTEDGEAAVQFLIADSGRVSVRILADQGWLGVQATLDFADPDRFFPLDAGGMTGLPGIRRQHLRSGNIRIRLR